MSDIPYPHLFSPFSIGNVTLKNRVVMAPMSTEMGGLSGDVTPQMIAFYRERALGGTGLIIVEYTCVGPATGRAHEHQLTLENADNLDGHIRLVNAVHQAGSHIFMQLQHSGQYSNPAVLPDGMPAGPSDVVSKRSGKQFARALSSQEVGDLVEAFGVTAQLAVDAGYDGVELHGAHGYLLTQFLSPYANHRNDEWGGDFERRLRFPCTVVERVKRALGERPLVYRLSADEFMAEGNSIDDIERIVPHLVAAGADMIHVSTGWGTGTGFTKVMEPMSAEEGWRIPYARRIRESCNVPVITVGQIRKPAMADQAVADGSTDLVALGRPLLADPFWAEKAERGDPDAIRPCTSCNWCISLQARNMSVSCAENPRTGAEAAAPLTPDIGAGRTAVVVGAGPGGIAAALMLEQAGFNTTLFEARPRLGGGIVASATPPGKDKLWWYNDYLERQLKKSNVTLRLGKVATVADIEPLAPAVVMVAAGTVTKQLPIDGIDHPMVVDAYELLMGAELDPIKPGQKVVVYGGGETGCETAEYLAQDGADVTLVTRSGADQLARSAEMVYRIGLTQRIAENDAITVTPHSHIVKIDDGRVHLDGAEGRSEIAASKVFIAQGRESNRLIAEQLLAAGIPCSVIGDSREVGRIGDAVLTAYQAVQALRAEYANPVTLAC